MGRAGSTVAYRRWEQFDAMAFGNLLETLGVRRAARRR
jgi:hypothetical protein